MKLQRKSVKGFTLIELIIVMAIFGIIMTALIQFVNPVEKAYNSTELMSQQRYAQNNMIKYVTESTKYANAVCIIESSTIQSPQDARAFYWNNIISKMSYVDEIDSSGVAQMAPYVASDIQVIEINRHLSYGGRHGYFTKLSKGTGADYVALKNVYGKHDYRILITGFEDRGGGIGSSYDVSITSIYERNGAEYKLTSTDSVRLEGGNLIKDVGAGVLRSSNGPTLGETNPSHYPEHDPSIAADVFTYYGEGGVLMGTKPSSHFGDITDAQLKTGSYPSGVKNSYICYVSMDDPTN